MKEIVKHINDTNASYRDINAGDAKNTDLFLDNEHYELFRECGDTVTVRFNKDNLCQAILFIASILPRKYDNSSNHFRVNYSSSFVLEQLAILDAFFRIDGKEVNQKTQDWGVRKDVMKKNGDIDNRFYFNGLIENVNYTFNGLNKTSKFTIRNYIAGGYSDLHIKKASDGIFDVTVTNVLQPYNDGKDNDIMDSINTPKSHDYSYQQIFYGAPGTGKSHRIKELLEEMNTPKENIFRTTFHPDSDYSSFVGAYKPTMKKRYRYNGQLRAKYYEDDDLADAKQNDFIIDKVIEYNFIPQAFIKAYMRAYQTQENVYLIIEEINRGNCAQIFGDLFQLLDRDENGFSDYSIKADTDLKSFIEDELGKDNKGILDGELRLPSNLFIWATMNTSDQSLFPIDSAFKRRWDWEYEPIKYKNTDWVIDINGIQYSWTSFQKEVNERIFEATNSEDKMLGDFFVKPHNNVISEKLLLNKILFYLWNDVCKDGDGDIFKTSDGMDIKFSDLYGKNGISLLISMMRHLGVALLTESVGGNEEIYDVEDDEYNEDVVNEENTYENSKGLYSINGRGNYNQSHLCTQLVKSFIESNSQMSADEVVNQWRRLGNIGPHFIETQAIYDLRTDKSKYAVNTLQCNGDTIYLATNIWTRRRIDLLIKLLPKEWNLNVNRLS